MVDAVMDVKDRTEEEI